MSNKSITELWPSFPTLDRVYIEKTEGAYLYGKDQFKILDAAGGAIVVNIGHSRKEVADAIYNATTNSSYILPPWSCPERESLMTELRAHWLPTHLNRVHLSSGGSEANETAVKIAIQYQAARGKPAKRKILTRSLSYHGTTISMAAISGHANRKKGLENFLEKYPTTETPYPLRCPIGRHHPEATDYYISNLKKVIKKTGPENIAALIAEPIIGSSGGAITPPLNYWEEAQEILKKNDILLIADEVMTGFGRIGEKFACNLYDIKADILVAGKGMAGGYAAISGTYSTDEIVSAIESKGYEVMFHTFAALPQSCAASATVLKIIREERLLERVKVQGAKLKEKLISTFSDHPNVAEIRGEGLLLGIEILKDKENLIPFDREENITFKIIENSLEEGVFFYPGGTGDFRDIICIGPPFIIGEEEIELIIAALNSSLKRIHT